MFDTPISLENGPTCPFGSGPLTEHERGQGQKQVNNWTIKSDVTRTVTATADLKLRKGIDKLIN